MVFTYSPSYACCHLFDAAYCIGTSYEQVYWTLYIKYGSKMAIKGYVDHLKRKPVLNRISS